MKLLISVLLIFSFSFAITKEEVIRLAKEKASKIKLSKEDIKYVEAQIKEVMSNIYPHLSIDGIYTNYDPKYITGFSLKNQYRASVSLTQTIFDKSVFESIKIAKLNKKLQKLIYNQVKNEVIYTALSLYEDILYKKSVLKLKEKNLNYWQKQFEFIKENYKQGFSNKYEFLMAKANYENALSQVKIAKLEYEKAVINLKKFIFLDKENIYPEENLNLYPVKKISKNSLKNNPELIAIKQTSKIKEEEAKFYTASLYPKISLKASYEFYNTRDFPALNEVVRQGYILNFSLKWQFFDGLNAQSKAIQSKINSAKEKIKFKEKLSNLEQEYENAFLDIKITDLNLKSIKENIKALQEALRLATERYRYKIGTILEILQAQKNLEEARLNEIRAIYQHNLAVLKIKKLLGEFAK